MSLHQDKLIAQYQSELENRQGFIDHLLEQAEGRDLNEHEAELVTKATDRMGALMGLLDPLRESARISNASRERMAEITRDLALARTPSAGGLAVEYRSAGQYVVDHWAASIGNTEAAERIGLYLRAAAHQTTGDNQGIIPTPIVGSVLNFIDSSRPIVSTLGVLAVPGGTFNRPKVTQHTQTGPQATEKTELVSRKMLITRVPVSMSTYGGYVNVSRQDIDFSSPNIMDLVVQDLAGQYAIETEQVTGTALVAGATAQTPVITATSTATEVTAAVWKAAGSSFASMQGAGRLVLAVSPDMMGAIGPLFTPLAQPVNLNATSGFQAGSFGSGAQGQISGITVVMSAGLAAGTVLLVNTASSEVYEQRIGSLQVTEPSVLGVQVAYAGYFAVIVLLAGGVVKLTA